jgi:hypothetical protein
LFSEGSKVLITHGGSKNEVDKGDCEIIVEELIGVMIIIEG